MSTWLSGAWAALQNQAHPNPFPVWAKEAVRAFPKLRVFTWETPAFPPAPYLQNRCTSAAATLSLGGSGGSIPKRHRHFESHPHLC